MNHKIKPAIMVVASLIAIQCLATCWVGHMFNCPLQCGPDTALDQNNGQTQYRDIGNGITGSGRTVAPVDQPWCHYDDGTVQGKSCYGKDWPKANGEYLGSSCYVSPGTGT
jgi:hypothetical protein